MLSLFLSPHLNHFGEYVIKTLRSTKGKKKRKRNSEHNQYSYILNR